MIENKLKSWMEKTSWKETFPMVYPYQSKDTFYTDIDMRNVLEKEKTLTFNPESPTGFDEIRLSIPTYNEKKIHPIITANYVYDTVLNKKTLCKDVINILSNYFKKTWDSSKFHLIYSSGGRDSRIIALILKKLEKEGMDLGDLLFLNHKPEHIEFKKSMEEMGWDKSQYLVWNDNLKQGEPNYYRFPKFIHNCNGFIGPIPLFRDIYINEKNTCLVSGSFSPGWRGLGKAAYFYLGRWASYFLALDYNLWDDILFPFLSYDLINYILFTKPQFHFEMEPEGGDVIRDEICRQLGSKTPFYASHSYKFHYSQNILDKIDLSYNNSKFANVFNYPIKNISNKVPYGRKILESKIYGLATTIERVNLNNKELKRV